jgi:hypothetical protein
MGQQIIAKAQSNHTHGGCSNPNTAAVCLNLQELSEMSAGKNISAWLPFPYSIVSSTNCWTREYRDSLFTLQKEPDLQPGYISIYIVC